MNRILGAMDPRIQHVFVSLGWALLAGFLILMVPLTYRKAKYADLPRIRIRNIILMILYLCGFCALAWWLWTTRVPKSDAAPEPSAPPVAVTEPA